VSYDIFSLGHADLSIERFIGLLAQAEVSAVADVRSSPFSRRAPWFNRPELTESLKLKGILYGFFGKELGGRPRDPAQYTGGVADYSKMAQTISYLHGLERLISGNQRHRVAMICSERDPLECHRCLLVSRSLFELGVDVQHIHHTGKVELQSEALERLFFEERIPTEDKMWQWDDRVDMAFKKRSARVAYSIKSRDQTVEAWHPKLL